MPVMDAAIEIVMTDETRAKDEVARRAGALVSRGYHLAEATMLAVGEYALGSVDDRTLRMTTGFSGGVGKTYRELCGALSVGIMITWQTIWPCRVSTAAGGAGWSRPA